MKNTIKSILSVSAPVAIALTIFNFTIIKTYKEAKQINMNRGPAVEKVYFKIASVK